MWVTERWLGGSRMSDVPFGEQLAAIQAGKVMHHDVSRYGDLHADKNATCRVFNLVWGHGPPP